MLRFRYTWPAAILAGLWSGFGIGTFDDGWAAARELTANQEGGMKFLVSVVFFFGPVMLLVWDPRRRPQELTMEDAFQPVKGNKALAEFAQAAGRGFCWFAVMAFTAESIP